MCALELGRDLGATLVEIVVVTDEIQSAHLPFSISPRYQYFEMNQDHF